mmetsp:Transcript_21208/g.29713  ORF Transcript_21208/g.29713 Transcript_21208/m.29713 type:complete len:84 (+) Transcript_21208:446-697(+)
MGVGELMGKEVKASCMPSPNTQKEENAVTVHKLAEFNLELLETLDDAVSKRNMNIADAMAAKIVHISPTLRARVPDVDPSSTW